MMSESKINFTAAAVELTVNEQANPAIPSWLLEALLVAAQYWQSHSLLEILHLLTAVTVSHKIAKRCNGQSSSSQSERIRELIESAGATIVYL